MINCYYRSYKGGRSPGACTADEACFSIVCGGVLTAVLFDFRLRAAVCAVCGLLGVLTVFTFLRALRERRIEKHAASVRKKAADDIKRLKLLSMPRENVENAVKTAGFQGGCSAVILKDDIVEVDDVLEAVRNANCEANGGLVILSASPVSNSAKETAAGLGSIGLVRIEFEALVEEVETAGLINASESEIDAFIKAGYKKAERKRFSLKNAFESDRILKYLLIGAAAIAFSFISKRALLLRLVGSIIITASFWMTLYSRIKRKPYS